MQIQEVINHIAAGDSVAAKESIENILSAKAFDALQTRKQEIASTLFGGQEQEQEYEEAMEEGIKGAAIGGALGSVGGPVGAAVGGALGHVAGEGLASLRKRTVAAGKAFATKPSRD
jgi:hypothetical protein